MNQLLSLPDWAPDWLGPVLMILGGLFALAFLLMPFTVFSLKSRLDHIEARLEDLHADLRALTAVPAAAAARAPTAWAEPPPAVAADRYPVHPPIPPRIQPAAARPFIPEAPRAEPKRGGYADDPRPIRAEPKLNWPR